MAIGVPVRPALIVYGVAVAIANRYAYEGGNRTDRISGFQVTLHQDSGSQVNVRFAVEDVRPSIGEDAAVVADVQESREYGASLVFQRNVIPDDLDRINSALSVPAGK